MNADITLKLHGKEYHMKGQKVEFKHRQWYVDDVLQDIPLGAADSMKQANDEMQESLREQLNGIFGNLCVNGHVENTYIDSNGMTIVKTRTRNRSKSSRKVIMKNGGVVNIHRGGKTYTFQGEKIEKCDGQWIVDGKAVNWNEIGGRYEEENVIRIDVHDNVE